MSGWVALVGLVAAYVLIYVVGRRIRNRPFRTEYAGIEMIVRPDDHAIQCLTRPDAEQLAAITEWCSDWHRVMRTRPFAEIA